MDTMLHGRQPHVALKLRNLAAAALNCDRL